jgi:uncharacterized OsmC-like protein
MAKLDTYLQRKAQVLSERRSDFEAAPERAMVRLTVSSWVAGTTGARPVRVGESLWITDSAPALAGNGLGPTAPEMLLGALASCLAHTYLIAAALHGTALDGVDVTVKGALDMASVVGLEASELPRMEQVTWHAAVTSPDGDEAVDRLHDVVDRLCPVLNTLRFPVEVRRVNADE